MNFGVDLFWPGYLVALVASAAVIAHVLAYARTSKPVRRPLKWLLLLIRLGAVGVLMFVLWRPAAESRQMLTRKARLALLVDVSKSMSIGDEETAAGGNCSRLARASGIFTALAPQWREITQSYEVMPYSFSKEALALPAAPEAFGTAAALPERADGPVTALGDALQEVTRGVPAPEAVLLISDGLSNSGVDPLDAAVPAGMKIHSISVGRQQPTESTRDAAATGIFAPAEAFVSSDVTVVGSFSMTGLEGRAVKVTFLVDGQEAGTKEIKADRREALVEAKFGFKPDKTGPVRLEVRSEALPDEIVAENNYAATYMDVKKGRLKVLYAEGTFRWEAKFLRLALESAGDIDLRLVVTKGEGDVSLAKGLEEEWDVLVVGDVPAAAFPEDKLPAVLDCVSAGRGVVFLGGANAFGRGGYAGTPLAAVIPFTVSSDEGLDRKPYRVSARPRGPYAQLAALDEAGGYDLWEKLPPLLSVNLVGAERAGATVLLEGLPVMLDAATGEFPADYSRAAAPVLAVEDYGRGRTAAMTGDGTWQWATGAGLTGTQERDRAAAIHRRFWRQLVFWLAKREERGGVTLKATLAKHRVEVGKGVEMEAALLDSDLKPLSDAEVTAQITSGEKKYTSRFWLEGKAYKGEFKPPESGDYKVNVTAVRSGGEVAEAATAFVACATDVELATLVSKPATLAALAKATGGAFAPAEGAGEVFSEIAKLAKLTQYSRLDRRELWSTWWYAALAVALLSFEWGLRKYAGLV